MHGPKPSWAEDLETMSQNDSLRDFCHNQKVTDTGLKIHREDRARLVDYANCMTQGHVETSLCTKRKLTF